MSGSKRQRPDPVGDDLPLKRLREVSISSHVSSATNDRAAPTEAISNEAAATPSISTLPAATIVTQATQVATSPAISALKTMLGGLRDSLTELPPLQMSVGGLLECIIHTEVEAQNCQAFDELAADLTNLATLLQSHAFELEPDDGPYSAASVVRVIEEQTNLVKAQQEHSRTSRSTATKDGGEVVLECYRRIGALFPHLQSGILLSLRDESKQRNMDTLRKDLCPVYDAFHNAALPTSATKRVGCTQGTRVDLLNTTLDWAHGGDAAKIYWLNGMAGTGKTTIAYTLCEILQQDRLLAASFFCSRNSADCRNVNRVVPTIAYQLGQNSGLYRQELLKALRSDSDAPKRNIGTQFRHLILEPFEKIGEAILKDVIVVIDALDECDDEAGTKAMLSLLIRHAGKLPVKFFISSRPEPSISDSMEARTGALRSIMWLHDIEKSLVQADIRLYLMEALESVDISPSEIDQLAARAGNLFIFAATAVRHIFPDRGTVNRRQRLQTILGLQPSQKHRSYQDIDNLYATILANALDTNIYDEYEVNTRQRVLWTAICAREPLTIPALAEILHMPDKDAHSTIQSLRSVLHVSEISSAVSALHASFPDFLLAKERAGKFYCDKVTHNSELAACCFEVMGQSLKFNICGLESSHAFDSDVPNLQTRVDDAISTGLFYSCRYWGDHLTKGPPSLALLSLLGVFLQRHLLFWMEVLHLKQRIGYGGHALSDILTWLPTENEWTELRDFIHDTRDFLTSFAGNPTSLLTPHIYISTLPFTPKDSRVWTTYRPRMRGLVEVEGVATEARGKSALAVWDLGDKIYSIAQSSDGRRLATGYPFKVSVWDVSSGTCILGPLEGQDTGVQSVAFSPDNSRIASGLQDGTIRMWDAHNGDLVVGPLAGHTSYVYSVAFLPNGTRLASGSGDCTIRIWDPYTGVAIGDVYRHRGAVHSVTFSPDSKHLASGSADSTIRVWNWRIGVAALGPLEGHSGSVHSVAYSSDGSRLASGSSDCTVRVWDMSSGALLAGPFEGHTSSVLSVSFSPNDVQIVSGSSDRTIRVWEVVSGNLLAGPFEGHQLGVTTVLFTADGNRILSASNDGTIRVWDARHRTTGATESLGHSGGIESVAMSPDGSRVASGSRDKTICVWDAYTGALVASPFKGHTDEVRSVAFSPDGARIVSGSDDHTLRTWDASTGALLVGPIKGHTTCVYSVAFSPDGSEIASSSLDSTIRLWDSYTGESVAEPFKGHTGWVNSIAFSPDGTRIVSGSSDKTVRMWNANDGTALWTSNAHTNHVFCVAFSPDGTHAVSGSRDENILVLDAADGAVLRGPFIGHTYWVNSVAFSPDGTRVVSGSYDQTVCVWDVQSGAVVVGPLKGHTQGVLSVAFSPDGARIISGSYDGTIRFWDVDAAARSDAMSFDGWSIDDNGWLTGSQSQRLFWVPPDLRDGFWFPTPSNPLAFNARTTTRVDPTFSGDRWHLCYDASLDSASS